MYIHAGQEEFFACSGGVAWTGAIQIDRLAKECKGRAAKPYGRNKLLEGHAVLRNGSCAHRGPAVPVPQGLEARLLAECITPHATRRDFVGT